MELLLVVVIVGSFWLGIDLMDGFKTQYGEIPINVPVSCLTSLFLIFAFFTYFGDGSRFWPFLWIALAIVFYVFAFRYTLETTKRVGADRRFTISAMASQALIPLGTALLVLLVLGMIFGGSGGKKR